MTYNFDVANRMLRNGWTGEKTIMRQFPFRIWEDV